jgi:hypothetical protein
MQVRCLVFTRCACSRGSTERMGEREPYYFGTPSVFFLRTLRALFRAPSCCSVGCLLQSGFSA